MNTSSIKRRSIDILEGDAKVKSKNLTIPLFITIIMAFLELSGLPAALFINVQILDIDSTYFILMTNFFIGFVICWVFSKTILKHWPWGLSFDGIGKGFRRYGRPAVIATLIVTLSFCIGLMPFDYSPSVGKVLVEGIIYYVGVSIMEELYLRGLLQNIFEKCFENRRNGTWLAVLFTSILFGLGHVSFGQPVFTVVAKVIWAMALGVYFGAIYVKTRNLWVPIFLHFLIDLCGIPFCFSTGNVYPPIATITCLICYLTLGVYGFYILRMNDRKE